MLNKNRLPSIYNWKLYHKIKGTNNKINIDFTHKRGITKKCNLTAIAALLRKIFVTSHRNKSIVIYFLLSLFLTTSCNTEGTKKLFLTGKWRGTDNKSNPINIILNPDGSVYWISKNIVAGCDLGNGQKHTYAVNTDSIPQQLDFVI